MTGRGPNSRPVRYSMVSRLALNPWSVRTSGVSGVDRGRCEQKVMAVWIQEPVGRAGPYGQNRR
jgi:hypothetical protein